MAPSSGNETGLRVGFIGLGLMGKPMAKNLLAAGNHLMVASRSRGPVDELVAAGASAATGLAELAGFAEAVITMLPTPAVTSEVLLDATCNCNADQVSNSTSSTIATMP